tara:strand:+ start:55 stop:237 length:183 start_codon:yes stop_codon:yes gene_type:complete
MKIEDNKYTEHAKRVTKRTQDIAKKTEEISLEVLSILEKWLEDVLMPFKEEKKDDHLKKK